MLDVDNIESGDGSSASRGSEHSNGLRNRPVECLPHGSCDANTEQPYSAPHGDPAPHKRSTLKGCSVLLGGALIHLSLGNIYSFGNLMTYMVSYMKMYVDFDIGYNNIIWVGALVMVAQGLFMPLGGYIADGVGTKLTCLLGCCFMSGGVALSSYTIDRGVLPLALSYGLMGGFGIACTYTTPLHCAMEWFPRRKGLANGVVMAGFGLGSLGSTLLQTLYLNPDNVSPGPDGYFTDAVVLTRVPSLFLVMAGSFIVLQLLGCSLVTMPPTLHTDSNKREAAADEETPLLRSPDTRCERSLSPLQAIKTGLFFKLWLVFLFNSGTIAYVSSTYKSFGQTFLSDDLFLAEVGSYSAFFNASGRVLWGFIMDKTSYQFAMFTLTLLLATLTATLPLTIYMGKVGFAIWVWATYSVFSGNFAIMPTATAKGFGAPHASKNYGMVFTGQPVAAIIVAEMNQLLLPVVGYNTIYYILAGSTLMGTVVTLLSPKRF